jgi:hypothetical protein
VNLQQKYMTKAVKLAGNAVEFPIDVKIGKNWGLLEKIKDVKDIPRVVAAAPALPGVIN